MVYKPLFQNVLLKPIEEAQEAIIIEKDPRDPIRATVVSVGPGEFSPNGTFISTQVSIGTTIWLYRHDARALTIDGQEHLVMHQRDILVQEEQD